MEKEDKITDVLARKSPPELRVIINEAQKWANSDRESLRDYLSNNFAVLYGLHAAIIEYNTKSQGHEKIKPRMNPAQYKAPEFNRNYSQQYRQPYTQAYGVPPPGQTPQQPQGYSPYSHQPPQTSNSSRSQPPKYSNYPPQYNQYPGYQQQYPPQQQQGGYPPQGYPYQQGYPPQGYPPQGYPPQNYGYQPYGAPAPPPQQQQPRSGDEQDQEEYQ